MNFTAASVALSTKFEPFSATTEVVFIMVEPRSNSPTLPAINLVESIAFDIYEFKADAKPLSEEFSSIISPTSEDEDEETETNLFSSFDLEALKGNLVLSYELKPP